MKEKLLLVLKPRFSNKGFSQKTLEGFANLMLETNLTEVSTDEEIEAAIEGVMPYANLMQAENNRYANRVKSKCSKPAKAVTKPADVEFISAETMDRHAWTKVLTESVQAFARDLRALQRERKVMVRREVFVKLMEKIFKEYQEREMEEFGLMNFKSDDEFNGFIAQWKDFAAEELLRR